MVSLYPTAKSSSTSDRAGMFEALAAYANMADNPEDWRRFRLMYPDFFPTALSQLKWPGFRSLAEWMYSFAEIWAKDLADLPPEYRPLPPLLWYRNRLRAVWSRNDRHGYALAILLGFEKEARNIAREHPGEIGGDALVSPAAIPGQPPNPFKQDTDGGLPQGRPQIDGVTGAIGWDFGCTLQRALYDLMRVRWRAKVCPQCAKCFVAAKTAQKVCSPRCSDELKRGRALAYWNETGKSKRRTKARTK